MADAWIDPNYSVPSSASRYMKLEDGDNLVRALDKPVMGEELWMEGKPTRKRLNESWTAAELAKADISTYTGEKRKPQHFWALPVWSYADNSVQVLHITQVEIQRPLLNLVKNPKWGALTEYDVVITKGKDGKRVTYQVTPDPKAKLSKEVKDAWKAVKVDWDKYFEGGHPIEVAGETFSDEEIDDIIND